MASEMKKFLTGSKALTRLLEDARGGSVRQAYIFEGAKGIGKFTAANLFAQAIHCTGTNAPCGVCEHCRMHMAGTHSDLYITGGEKAVKVEDVRNLTDELFIRPALSDKKICIIRDADTMNSDAQNALLKSFEEPPSYGVIILLSENVKNLLPTIRSRGIRISFEPFSSGSIEKYVEAVFPEKKANASFIAAYSGGIIGKALDICENEDFFLAREEMFGACSALASSKLSVFQVAEAFGAGKRKGGFENCALAFDLFTGFMRDVLSVKIGEKIINEDKQHIIDDFASKVTVSAVLSIIEKAADVRSQLNVSMEYRLWIVDLLVKCWEDIHGKGSRG